MRSLAAGSSAPGIVPIAALGLLALAACGTSEHTSTFDSGPTHTTTDAGHVHPLPHTGPDGGTSDGGNIIATPSGPVKDFPTPVFDGTAPSNSASLFGPAAQGAATGGPCIVEPESNVLYPQDWLRPRFRWNAVGGQNLFELRLHVKNQIDDLVVYSTNTSWTMPLAMWSSLRTDSPTEPMTLSIRGGVLSGGTLTGESLGSSTSMEIAPVQATGAIVYWTTSNGTALKGFTVGDESVEQVLLPAQVTQTSTTCIGCHSASPDGEFVGVSLSGPTGWPNAMALVAPDAGTVGTPPSYLGAGGAAALARYNLGISSFSRAHWAAGDRREIVAYDDSGGTSAALQWIDIEAKAGATASGTIARNGDTRSAGAPSWSHDGNTIAYVSTTHFCDGRLGAGCDGVTYTAASDPGSTADVYTVPYANGAGGAAKPVAGASDPSKQEYYPVFSPDDAWLAFVSIPNGLNMYDQAEAEVSVIPASGGTATRLAANDPPACSAGASPGITNSWPKWGPAALQANGSTYYWLVFSSTRSPGGLPQLFITGVVVTGTKVETHGSIYLWNQPATEGNHTPAWDTFKVPPVTGGPK
jgi:hypothetical protein